MELSAPTLRRTPLTAAHEALGARLVRFAGWQMPIQYDGVVAEHLHVRARAGVFDLSHMGRLHLEGPDAAALVQRATTNDIDRLDVGAAQYSLICNEQGGVVEDLLVYRRPQHWLLIVNAANRARVLDILAGLRERFGFIVDIQDETSLTALIGVQGPTSAAVLQQFVRGDLEGLAYYHAQDDAFDPSGRSAAAEPVPAVVSRSGYTGEDGFEVVVPAEWAVAVWGALLRHPDVRPIGLGARDTLRLEAGMALYGHELTEAITPYEARLGRVVRLEKGPFLGREALIALRQVTPSRLLVGLRFEPGAVPRAGFDVVHHGVRVGEIASGTFSPTLRRPIATAYVRADLADVGRELHVRVREALVPAQVVSLPFVPHRTRRERPA